MLKKMLDFNLLQKHLQILVLALILSGPVVSVGPWVHRSFFCVVLGLIYFSLFVIDLFCFIVYFYCVC